MKEPNYLLEHFVRMQKMCMHYLQPPVGQTQADQRAGFIVDMIGALDGPEQRSVQAWASFDFLSESERTVSGEFFGSFVSYDTLIEELETFVRSAARLDAIKKLLFYGEDVKKGRLRHTSVKRDANEVIQNMSYDDESADNAVNILHAVLGIATEAGELVEAIHKVQVGEGDIDLDNVNIIEEVGDIQWYEAMLARAFGTNFGRIQRSVIAKLRDRFPDKFTTDAANNRDLDKERATLFETQKGIDWAKDEAELNGTFEVHNPSHGEPGYREPRKQSSARMSSLAASVMNRTAAGADLDVTQLIADARSLAASVLSQDETPGQ